MKENSAEFGNGSKDGDKGGRIQKTLKRLKWPALFTLCKGDGVERRSATLWLGDADGDLVL